MSARDETRVVVIGSGVGNPGIGTPHSRHGTPAVGPHARAHGAGPSICVCVCAEIGQSGGGFLLRGLGTDPQFKKSRLNDHAFKITNETKPVLHPVPCCKPHTFDMATREKTCGTFDMAAFCQATGTLKFGLYYGSNSSELSFSVSFAEEKRPHDAGGQLGQIGEPARSHRQWQSGHFTGEVHGAGEVHSLGYVVQVYGEVFHPVRVPEEAVPPQNTMLRWHACADEV